MLEGVRMRPAPLRFISAIARMLRQIFFGKPTGVSTEEYQRRMDICAKCPYFDRTIAHHPQCSFCSCFLILKASISTESCPKGHWPGDKPR